jgi:uncharacterized membrane protein HdeD (DUF308 family)
MKASDFASVGATRLWWLILLVGILLVLGGFAYWFWPAAGYEVAGQIFGWLLILAGIVQLCVAAGPDRAKGWGWWIAGGMMDLFIGFMMVRSILLSDIVLPYFFGAIFIFWGIDSIVNAVSRNGHRYWWLGLINGILLSIIGFMFFESGIRSDIWMVSFLTSIAFIYWGFTVAMTGYALKPYEGQNAE